MIHTLMEVDLHTTVPPSKVRGPTGLPFGTLRHHKQNRMLKRERSPEESDADADRPLVGCFLCMSLGWLSEISDARRPLETRCW